MRSSKIQLINQIIRIKVLEVVAFPYIEINPSNIVKEILLKTLTIPISIPTKNHPSLYLKEPILQEYLSARNLRISSSISQSQLGTPTCQKVSNP